MKKILFAALLLSSAPAFAGIAPKKSGDVSSDIVNQMNSVQGTLKDIYKGDAGGFKQVADAAKQVGSNYDKIKEQYDALTGHDKKIDPEPEPPGMPEVPLNCQKSGKCSGCFTEAYEALKQARISFERLRAVWATSKTIHDRGLALGDSAGSIHGIVGMQWQAERVKIEAAWKNVEKSYDAKHEELSLKLKTALQKIGECEREHYGVDDWYNRYGFIYYTFMSDRYRRDR